MFNINVPIQFILDDYRCVSGTNYKPTGPNEAHVDVAAIFSDDDVIYQHGFVNPRTMLRLSKLMLFVRVVRKAPPLLLEVISAQANFKKGWVSSLLDDLAWVSAASGMESRPALSLEQWIEQVKRDPSLFARRVKDFCKSPFANVVAQWAVSPVLQVFAQPVRCVTCNHLSKSYQAHCLHQFRVHSIKNVLRCYVPCTHCLVCLREFHTRENSLNHVRYRSKVCRLNLLLRGPCLTTDQANSLDDACSSANVRLYSEGKRRHHVDQPSFLLSGPLLPIVLSEGQYSAHHPLGRRHRYT